MERRHNRRPNDAPHRPDRRGKFKKHKLQRLYANGHINNGFFKTRRGRRTPTEQVILRMHRRHPWFLFRHILGIIVVIVILSSVFYAVHSENLTVLLIIISGIYVMGAIIFLCHIIRFWATVYWLTNFQVGRTDGIINKKEQAILIEEVQCIDILQSHLLQRLTHVGTVQIWGTGGKLITFELAKNPYYFKKAILIAKRRYFDDRYPPNSWPVPVPVLPKRPAPAFVASNGNGASNGYDFRKGGIEDVLTETVLYKKNGHYE